MIRFWQRAVAQSPAWQMPAVLFVECDVLERDAITCGHTVNVFYTRQRPTEAGFGNERQLIRDATCDFAPAR
jgi:hypothetical protein